MLNTEQDIRHFSDSSVGLNATMDIKTNSDYTLKEKYLGSRKFQFVADAVGLPIDQVNFIFGQILALVVAYLFRVVLHPSNVSAASRHWTALSAGLCISYFCFGKQALLAILLVIMCYCLLNLLPPTIFHHATLFCSISFLSAVHIQRQFYEDGNFVVDITGPLMIIVQKATSLAYSLSDGLFKETSTLTPLQKKYAINKKPSALEYFSYLLCFHSILAGPFFMFTDYHDFIEGTHYLRCESYKKKNGPVIAEQETLNNNKKSEINFSGESNNHKEGFSEKASYTPLVKEPNPMESAVNKTLLAAMCALTVIFILPNFPITHLTDPSFFASSITYKLAYIIIATSLVRHVYYCAWYLGDAICTMSGLGFSGYDMNDNCKWDLVSNVNLIGVEFGTSLKTTLESWNIGTMKWLRFLVYERAKSQKTVLTYLLSSIWHGFYPGYYLAFLGGAFFTIVSRTVRRSLRPRVLKFGAGAKRLYDFTTFLVARLCLSYITFPFVMLRFWPSIFVYNSLRYYLHSFGMLAMFLLPIALPPLRRSTKISEVDDVKPANGTTKLRKDALTIGKDSVHQKVI